jgi:hypothetical protein
MQSDFFSFSLFVGLRMARVSLHIICELKDKFLCLENRFRVISMRDTTTLSCVDPSQYEVSVVGDLIAGLLQPPRDGGT